MREPLREGPAPAGLVMQLAGPDGAESGFGHVFNTSAIEGQKPEGFLRIRFREHQGRYPDGAQWTLREPIYDLAPAAGRSLDPGTVLKPRIAPALFGAGLLDAVPDAAIHGVTGASGAVGRFGWQSQAHDLREQTAQALSREMGLTSSSSNRDDCGAKDAACTRAPHGGDPEVSPDFMEALLMFQRALAVPRVQRAATDEDAGLRLFGSMGCAACHAVRLPVAGVKEFEAVAAYTDLRLHDLGDGLADRDAEGRIVPTRWRTAPLWGLGYAVRDPASVALLHDGRASSIEEAILWHQGEAASARQRFEQLAPGERRRLLNWMSTR